ncbi:YeiH family protein [Lampropedia aestuarii]|uniref:YeiH family protein n=1 Tax=Lampropedia aestuarii TaxID=2562762 RepID=UPI002468787B|nr:YeiH family protein [Lampropedia aestuarii]MDH5856896.1 YeiH family protein [Lampropedia aestuarii]
MTTLLLTGALRKANHAGVLVPGIVLSAAVGTLSMLLAAQPWFKGMGLSALTLAIVLGMLIGNSMYGRLSAHCGAGVGFSKQTLLRLGIVLYGFRLTVQDVAQVGIVGVATDLAMVVTTFGLAIWIGVRCLGIDKKTAILIGAGSSICGAAAVLATEPVVKGKAEQVAVAVATVVVFGTIATFLYPVLYALNGAWGLVPAGEQAFGVYIGSTVHEVAQVVAAGDAISASTSDTAVIVKMVRVMMLAPFLICLAIWLRAQTRGHVADAKDSSFAKAVPWFALGFIAVVVLNSLQLQPAIVNEWIVVVDNFLLATAMAALGLTTHWSAIKKAGVKPLLMALGLFFWLVVGGAALNAGMDAWLA